MRTHKYIYIYIFSRANYMVDACTSEKFTFQKLLARKPVGTLEAARTEAGGHNSHANPLPGEHSSIN